MTRVAYTDLFLNFDPDVASIIPDDTQCGNVITMLYKKAYSIVYGAGYYSADDSTDTSTIISSDEMFAVLQAAASRICNSWFESGLPNGSNELVRMPKFDFNMEERNEIFQIIVSKRGTLTVDNVDRGDYE